MNKTERLANIDQISSRKSRFLCTSLPHLHVGCVRQAVQHQHDVGQENPENQASEDTCALACFDARHVSKPKRKPENEIRETNMFGGKEKKF